MGGESNRREVLVAQQQEMTELVTKYMSLATRIADGEDLTDKEWKAYDKLDRLVSKFVDKIHASKESTDITSGGEKLDAVLVKFLDGKDNRNPDGVQKPVQQ